MPKMPEIVELRVRDLMQPQVITIARDASVQELAELLRYHDISGVPVVGPDGSVVGVVAASDLVRLAAEHGESAMWYVPEDAEPKFPGYFAPERVTPKLLRRLAESILDGYLVQDIMTPATFSIREEAMMPELAEFLLNTGVHRALVMERGRLHGIVTTTDVLRALAGKVEPQRERLLPPVQLLAE
jgi:CBS domain-containing protein